MSPNAYQLALLPQPWYPDFSNQDTLRAAGGPHLHTRQPFHHASLPDLVDSRQAGGRYVLTRAEALASLGVSDEALKKSVQRLVAKRRLVVPRRGFFVIVPLEYRQSAAPPPDWYIDALMESCGRQYYVGLLSAAALHGAAREQPQEFQVVTDIQWRPVAAGRGRIRFFRKQGIAATPTVDVKTETGFMRVSTPEATALDLLRYLHGVGQLGQAATILAELAAGMDAVRTAEAARLEGDLPNAQRLGHLLDAVGAGEVGTVLAEWVAQQHPRFVALRPDRPSVGAAKDGRWRVLVNEEVEVEEFPAMAGDTHDDPERCRGLPDAGPGIDIRTQRR